ncbi:SDR family NAD(P)-dependent oxidoreductase [Mesoterricola sediminis]|uniref:2,5-dichloro-2,5-cyclohexadiene-1,4-diol dehydrogenase n=1 Tax=Mesoterricola sediminis TaxID=2927980 RepID=A0AA48KD60_9BACT|nr:glucose 1-dehydrogenase [Mesoterricola sediminis]BDU75997.1 2,5-dichloro-2,5-cyclohexadiene-1,4-diol dehydrogenase [Mesoterricola sediminis]
MTYTTHPALTAVHGRLRGKVVLVTGASSGIGEAAARLFAKEGASVVAAARRMDRIESITEELREEGLRVWGVVCDVTDEDSVAKAVKSTMEHFGRLDAAFNNAGIPGAMRPLHELVAADFDRVLATNLKGAFLCMKHEIPAMLASGGGAIVNNASIGGLVGAPDSSFYGASKWGLVGMTKCAALDYARKGIRVNAIAPGPTRSEMFDGWMATEAARERLAAAMPMNYIAHPDDMARAALYLLTDEARWTTGAVLACDGGASAD